jgi:hypothetical protein
MYGLGAIEYINEMSKKEQQQQQQKQQQQLQQHNQSTTAPIQVITLSLTASCRQIYPT